MVERPLADREVVGSIPSRVIPKTLKMVVMASLLGAQDFGLALQLVRRCQYEVTGRVQSLVEEGTLRNHFQPTPTFRR